MRPRLLDLEKTCLVIGAILAVVGAITPNWRLSVAGLVVVCLALLSQAWRFR